MSRDSRGWGARVVLSVVWLAAMSLLAACGARTSMLDPDQTSFGSSLPSGGTDAGGSANAVGGAASVPGVVGGVGSGGGALSMGGELGTAGTPSTTVGGAPDDSTAEQACSKFCSALSNSECPGEPGPLADCNGSCSSELGASDQCLQLGKAVMACYLPIFAANAGHCSAVSEQAADACVPQLKDFQQCGSMGMAAVTCSGSGSGSDNLCTLSETCSDGSSYRLNCKQTGQTSSMCDCNVSGAATSSFMFGENVAFACADAMTICKTPSTLPK